MSFAVLLLAFVTLQRLSELVIARRNTRRLLAAGGVEVGREHYPAIVALHAAWLVGLWALGWDEPINPLWLAAYALLQALRGWVLGSLGARWTTRIIVVPGETLVRRGPYRWLPHPNYLVVAGEIAVLPLTLGLGAYALVFSGLNAAVLFVRIRAENRALAEASMARPRSSSS
jgi:methyltransferase